MSAQPAPAHRRGLFTIGTWLASAIIRVCLCLLILWLEMSSSGQFEEKDAGDQGN